MTMKQFISKHDLTMKAVETDSNPNMDDVRNPMDHWKVIIRRAGGKAAVSLVYSMGSAHGGRKPELSEVLDCIADDARTFHDYPDVQGWAGNFGLDPEEKGVKKTFRAVQRQSEKLETLLGACGLAELFRVCSEGEADESGKEVGRIVPSGMGGFLNPPGHPEHDYHVATGPEHNPSGSQSLSSAVESEWLSPVTREAARAKLAACAPLPMDDPTVKDWVSRVLGYYRGMYADPSKPEVERWNATNLRNALPANFGEMESGEVYNYHAGVNLIRQYYPEYVPTDADLDGAYWGTKPTK